MEEIESSIPPSFTGDPNNIYDAGHTLIYTLSSMSDTDKLCNIYNHDNGYNGLSLGQRIQINDGVYNKAWMIAGFDCDADNIADDGTPSNNGYGIFLIPEDSLFSSVFHINTNPTPYVQTSIHTSTLSTVANNLKTVLGDHLVNRNVLLGSSVNQTTCITTAYRWTKAYCVLMSQTNLTGTVIDHAYHGWQDTGEANYKLPLFKVFGSNNANFYWLRDIFYLSISDGTYLPAAYYRNDALQNISPDPISYLMPRDGYDKFHYIRPLIYIR